jgi:hypothetical protein
MSGNNYFDRSFWIGTAAERVLCVPFEGAYWIETDTELLWGYWAGSWHNLSAGGGGPASCFVCDVDNTYGGDNAFDSHTTASDSTAVGYDALTDVTDAVDNCAFGSGAGANLISGSYNVAIGYHALYNPTSAESCIAIGWEALRDNTAVGSIGIGDSALAANTSGEHNIAIGYYAMQGVTSAENCVAIGYEALNLLTSGDDNIAIGFNALHVQSTGHDNIAIGPWALVAATDRSNIGIGSQALFSAISTYNNIAVGQDALFSLIDGGHGDKQGANNAIGACSLFDLTFGSYNCGMGEQFGTFFAECNTCIGDSCGSDLGNGSENTGIGFCAVQGSSTAGDWNTGAGAYTLSNLNSVELNSIDDFSDYSGTIPGTVKAHNTDPWGFGLAPSIYTNMRITGTDHYDGNYTITVIDANNFYFTHAWNGDDVAAGYWMSSVDYALYANGNSALGYDAGDGVADGSYNTCIGYEADVDTGSETNSMALGANALATKSNQIVIGDDNIDETLLKGVVGINEATVAAQLDVAQTNAAGAIPVLELDQSDEDDVFINFVGTSAADQTKSISTINGDGVVTGPKNFSTSPGWEYVGMVKVEINGSAYWMPYYQPDIA